VKKGAHYANYRLLCVKGSASELWEARWWVSKTGHFKNGQRQLKPRARGNPASPFFKLRVVSFGDLPFPNENPEPFQWPERHRCGGVPGWAKNRG
jgi:hypothetical protein